MYSLTCATARFRGASSCYSLDCWGGVRQMVEPLCSPAHLVFLFLVCYTRAATQLFVCLFVTSKTGTLPRSWERIRMVHSSKVTVILARIERYSRNWHIEPILFLGVVVCACSWHALAFKMLFLRFFVWFFWFLVCCAATQLVLQLQQECTQVVWNHKVEQCFVS